MSVIAWIVLPKPLRRYRVSTLPEPVENSGLGSHLVG